MGQYRQWLQHREADQQLRTALAQLEAEMISLQEQVHIVADVSSFPSPAHNPLILALVASLDSLSFSTTSVPLNGSTSITKQDTIAETTQSPTSPMEYTLDPVESKSVEKDTPFSTTTQEVVTGSVPHPEMTLLPEDIMMFFDEQAQTDPQLELPWWLRNLIEHSLSGQGTRPIDPESLRTNRLVQRWSERWGQQLPPSPTQSADAIDYKKMRPTSEGPEQ